MSMGTVVVSSGRPLASMGRPLASRGEPMALTGSLVVLMAASPVSAMIQEMISKDAVSRLHVQHLSSLIPEHCQLRSEAPADLQ